MENFDNGLDENKDIKPFEKEINKIEDKFAQLKPSKNGDKQMIEFGTITINRYEKMLAGLVSEVHYEVINKSRKEILHIDYTFQTILGLQKNKIISNKNFLYLKSAVQTGNEKSIYSGDALQNKKIIDLFQKDISTVMQLKYIMDNNKKNNNLKNTDIESSLLYKPNKPKKIIPSNGSDFEIKA